MKQLLIVNSANALNAAETGKTVTAYDYSGLKAGAISFIQLDRVNGNTLLAAKPTRNFAIALGRPKGQVPFVIPEVDLRTLSVVKAVPKPASMSSLGFTVPKPADVATLVNPTSLVHSPIAEYGITFIKKGTVPHERNTWNVSIASQSDSTSVIAQELAKAINDKTSDTFPFRATVDDSAIDITCLNLGEEWTFKFTDCLDSFNNFVADQDQDNAYLIYNSANTEVGSMIIGCKAMGDMADIQDLASRCAAGKGFTDTYRDGDTIYPGYPEAVENTTYNVYTLRFRVGRDAAKTRDERVWQIVHIAVPVNGAAVSAIETILGVSAANAGGGGHSDQS